MLNGYLDDFTHFSEYFKKFVDNMHIVRGTVLTVEKKSFVIDFLYVSLKNIDFGELVMVFKIKTRLDNTFQFSDRILNYLSSGVIHKIQCELFIKCYYSKCVKYLNVKTGQNIGISQVTKQES